MPDHAIESIVPRLASRVHTLMRQHGVPGMAIGIVRDQELAWSEGFGYADLASARRLDENTIFGVASITKTFTGLAIVQLRDEDKLGLDDPVVRHIPELAAVRNRYGRAEDVTLRGLLTHRSGLVGEPPVGHWTHLRFPTMADILDLLPRIEVVIEPTTAFKYCNLGFALLGEVVERVSGRPFTEYAEREILAPLGMASTGFEIEAERSRTATGYMTERYEDVPAVAPDPAMTGYAAAAGLRSTVADLARWAALQFRTKASERSGPQVLAGRSVAEMHRVTYVEPDWKTGYALPWIGLRIGENIYLTHSGSVPGFLSTLAFNKAHRVAVIVLSNKQGQTAHSNIAFEALEMLVARLAKEGRARSAPPAPAPAAIKPLLGRYEGDAIWGVLLHIEYRDGEVYLVSPPDPFRTPTPPPTRLRPTDNPDVYIVSGGRPAGEALAFERDAAGSVVSFLLGENGDRFRKT